jgi:hypothetical protein
MIPPSQLEKYVKKRAIVIWATTLPDSSVDKVVLQGWNHAHEVKNWGVAVRTICDNIWLQDEDLMHPMKEIFEHF